MQIRTKHPLVPTIKQTADGWTVTVGSAPEAITAKDKFAAPKKSSDEFPDTVPPLDSPKPPPAVAPKPVAIKTDAAPAATIPTGPKPIVKKLVEDPPFPETVPPLELASTVQSPALAAALKQAGAKVTIVHHDATPPTPVPTQNTEPFAMQFQPVTSSKQRSADTTAQQLDAPFPDRVPPLEMAVKHSARPESIHKTAPPSERLINLNCTDADLPQILKGLALQTGANIMISPDVKGKVTASLHSMPVEQALRQLATLTGVKFESVNGLYIFGVEPKEAKPAAGGPDAKPTEEERTMEKIVPIQSDAQDQIKSAIEARFKDAHLNVFSSTGSDSKPAAAVPQGAAAAQGQAGVPPVSNTQTAPLPVAIDSQVMPARYIILIGSASVVEEASELAKEMDNDIAGAADKYEKVTRSERELFAYDVKFSDPRALREAVISQIPGLRATIPPNSAAGWLQYDENKQIAEANQTVGGSNESNQQTASAQNSGSSNAYVDDHRRRQLSRAALFQGGEDLRSDATSAPRNPRPDPTSRSVP